MLPTHSLGFPFQLLKLLNQAMEESKITGHFELSCMSNAIEDSIMIKFTPAGPLARGKDMILESKSPAAAQWGPRHLKQWGDEIVSQFKCKFATALPVVKA